MCVCPKCVFFLSAKVNPSDIRSMLLVELYNEALMRILSESISMMKNWKVTQVEMAVYSSFFAGLIKKGILC